MLDEHGTRRARSHFRASNGQDPDERVPSVSPQKESIMQTTMKIAVAGATGRVGRHVVDVLKGQGHEIVPMSRSHGIDVVTGKGLAEALVGVDAVVTRAVGPLRAGAGDRVLRRLGPQLAGSW